MKNILGLNLTYLEDDNTTFSQKDLDGAGFIIKTLSEEEMKVLEENEEIVRKINKKLTLHPVLNMINVVCMILGLVCLAAIFTMKDGIEAVYASAPWLFILTAMLLLVSIGLSVFARVKKSRYLSSEEYKKQVERINSSANYSQEILGIPENAYQIDLLMYEYKTENKEGIQTHLPYSKFYTHTPLAFYLYKEGENLCFANRTTLFAINRSYFKGIDKVETPVVLSCWNKEASFDSAEYKEYGMSACKSYGGAVISGLRISVKEHYSVKISCGEGDFELLVPSYDVKAFRELLADLNGELGE